MMRKEVIFYTSRKCISMHICHKNVVVEETDEEKII
jgi:hypothetical protein